MRLDPSCSTPMGPRRALLLLFLLPLLPIHLLPIYLLPIHLLPIHLLPIHLLPIHLLPIHLLPIHLLPHPRLQAPLCWSVCNHLPLRTCVDEAALCDALKRKAIKGACLDVFEKEPLVAESPLWGLDNVLLSPHNADNTRSYYPSTMERFVELTVNFYLKGRPFPETVDLDQGY